MALEDVLDPAIDLAGAAQAGTRLGEAAAQGFEFLGRGGEAALAAGTVAQRQTQVTGQASIDGTRGW